MIVPYYSIFVNYSWFQYVARDHLDTVSHGLKLATADLTFCPSMTTYLLLNADSEGKESQPASRTSENQTEAAAETVTSGSNPVSSSLVFNSFPLINNSPVDRPYLTALLTDDGDLASGDADVDHHRKDATSSAKDSNKMDEDDNDLDNPYVRTVKMPKIEKKSKR